MEYPDKSSATYRSLTGLIDGRVDLDRSIAPADSRCHAALCVMASKVAYENEAFIRDVVTRRWKMEFVKFFDCWNGNEHFCSTEHGRFHPSGTAEHGRNVVFVLASEFENA